MEEKLLTELELPAKAGKLSASRRRPIAKANTQRIAASRRIRGRRREPECPFLAQPAVVDRLQGEGFTYFGSTKAAVQDLVKKPQQVGQIQPKSAVEASCIETPTDECIMPLDHHEPFALHAMHNFRSRVRSSVDSEPVCCSCTDLALASTAFAASCQAFPLLLSKPSKDQCDAAGKESSAQDCNPKRENCTRAAARVALVQ